MHLSGNLEVLTMSLSQILAARFHNDGQLFVDDDGVSLEDAAVEAGPVGCYSRPGMTIFLMPDDSWFGVTDDCWDVLTVEDSALHCSNGEQWAELDRDGTPDGFTFLLT